MREITDINKFYDVIKNNSCAVEFYGSNCPACKQLERLIDNISSYYPHIEFIKVNVELYPEIAGEFAVMSVPTTIFINYGVNIGMEIGAVGKDKIIRYLNAMED